MGIGLLGVSLAFGLTVLTMAYAIGHICGCHLNPAVSVGLWAGGRFPDETAAALHRGAGGRRRAGGRRALPDRERHAGLHRRRLRGERLRRALPGGYAMGAALLCEVVLTVMFLFIIMGATDKRAPQGFAPIAIGLRADADPPDQHPDHQTPR